MQPYKKLFTYWYSLLIYDLTVEFCERWIRSYKLKEQINGAARSGKQNIVEGSDAMRTSIKSSIMLTGVAKASFEELIGDLEDFLRQRKLEMWGKSDTRTTTMRAFNARLVRNLSLLRNLQDDQARQEKQKQLLSSLPLPKNQEEATNLLLTLAHQETYLLDRQIASLEKKHKVEGGLTEKLYKDRTEYRKSVL